MMRYAAERRNVVIWLRKSNEWMQAAKVGFTGVILFDLVLLPETATMRDQSKRATKSRKHQKEGTGDDPQKSSRQK